MTVIKDNRGELVKPFGIECKISELKYGDKFFYDITPYSTRVFIGLFDNYFKIERECGWLDRIYDFDKKVYKL